MPLSKKKHFRQVENFLKKLAPAAKKVKKTVNAIELYLTFN
jgi:hypothetical protein